MQKMYLTVVAAAVILHGCSTAPAVPTLGGAVKATPSYISSVDNEIVTSGSGGCLRSIDWTSNNVVVECEASARTLATVTFDGMALFAFDSAELTESGQAELQSLVSQIESAETGAVEIVGHADSTGEQDYNQSLSERRANAVQTYLNQALGSMAMQARGMGETAPVADNTTSAGRQQNRRVEIVIKAAVAQ